MSEFENYLYVDQEKYGYDLLALFKSFYPEKQLKLVIPESRDEIKSKMNEEGAFAKVLFFPNGEKVSVIMGDEAYEFDPLSGEYADFKEGMDSFIYEWLAKKTGKQLPWGTLNGVRPTKLAYARLREGQSDEQIIDFYRGKRFVSEEKAQLSLDIAKRERAIMDSLHLEDGYSLYVGIPFCPSTCLYCSFTSFPIGAYRKMVDEYVDCLIKELRETAAIMQGKILDTVYIGGGTPTTLEPDQLRRLIGAIKEYFDFTFVQEFTVEAGRADSITEEKLLALKEMGVTRISVNPQTFNQETLDFIGRKATAAATEEVFLMARRLGFDNINMDLILGLPGEGVPEVARTIEKVKELAPDSLTVHSLAIKRASKLAEWIQKNGIEMLSNTEETMEIAAAGARELNLLPYYMYRQKNMSGNFENVGYAAADKFGIYNILIIEEVQTIVACGAGTVTKRVFYEEGLVSSLDRCDNVKDVKLYIEKIDEMIDRKKVLFGDRSFL